MREKLNAFFQIEERGSKLGTEVMAGVVTFLTMSYIIFLQPLILSGVLSGTPTGMDSKAIMVGVCLAAALGTFLMAFLANYPIALAPGMGENFFFVTTISSCAAIGIQAPWQTALAIVFVSGIIFLLLSILKVRTMIMDAISPSLKHGIAGGIGLFIATLGLKTGGLIVFTKDGVFLQSQHLVSITCLIFFVGLVVTAGLHVLKIKGAILWGIVSAAILALIAGKVEFTGVFSSPPSVAPVFAKMDFVSLWQHLFKLLPFIIIFTFMDVFDTIGTLVGVGTQAGLMKDNKLPKAEHAMQADSIATVFGSLCGNSTVTCYIESAAGVEFGGRTGLASVATGICFLLAMFLSPLVAMIGTYPEPGLNPITAPALVVIGAMMMGNIVKIDWKDYSESIPAFLIVIGIPLTTSIADGMVIGFVCYPLIKIVGGKAKETSWVTYTLGFVLLLYLILVKADPNLEWLRSLLGK